MATTYAPVVMNEANETTSLLLTTPTQECLHVQEDLEVTIIIYALFTLRHAHHQHPKTIPTLCPTDRGKRHRNPNVHRMNTFRHWWKSSRLLVRLAGSYEWCHDKVQWALMATFKVAKKNGAKHAFKQMKNVGRGGPNRDFLQGVKPFTRTIRIFLAVARALEARVDNRLFEVGVAEALAFMGNRCFRYWARHLTDIATLSVAFPLSAAYVAPYLDQKSRPVIVLMGLVRVTCFGMTMLTLPCNSRSTLLTCCSLSRFEPLYHLLPPSKEVLLVASSRSTPFARFTTVGSQSKAFFTFMKRLVYIRISTPTRSSFSVPEKYPWRSVMAWIH